MSRERHFFKHMKTWNILPWWRGFWGQYPNIWCLELSKSDYIVLSAMFLGFLRGWSSYVLYLSLFSCSRRSEKYFRSGTRLDWPDGATSRESMRAVWKLPRLPVIIQNLQLQNCSYKFGPDLSIIFIFYFNVFLQRGL